MAYGSGNTYNSNKQSTERSQSQYKPPGSYQNGFISPKVEGDDEGSGIFSLFSGSRRRKSHENIDDVLNHTLSTNYGAQGIATNTLDTMVRQREQVRRRSGAKRQKTRYTAFLHT